jgi:hypothetical protein
MKMFDMPIFSDNFRMFVQTKNFVKRTFANFMFQFREIFAFHENPKTHFRIYFQATKTKEGGGELLRKSQRALSAPLSCSWSADYGGGGASGRGLRALQNTRKCRQDHMVAFTFITPFLTYSS